MKTTQLLVHQDGEHLVHEYIVTGDEKLREHAVQAFLPLVKYIAGRVNMERFGTLGREDLYQYGVVGLLTALDRFQSSGATCLQYLEQLL